MKLLFSLQETDIHTLYAFSQSVKQSANPAPIRRWLLESSVNELQNNTVKYIPGGIKELLVIALPMMASNACDTIMTFTDRLFLSKLGASQMNASLGGGMMSFLMTTFFLGLIGYGTALIAQYYGSGQKRNCSVVVTQATIIAFIAYPLILLFAPLARASFRASGIAPEQLGPQTVFFNILVYGAIITLLRGVFSCFLSGIGKTRIVMIASVVSMLVNVGANYILVFGRFGFPALGIRGSAYGTIFGGLCGLLILMVAYFFGKKQQAYCIRESFIFNPDVMWKLFKFGYPAGLEFFLTLAAFTAQISLFQSQGQLVATAATIAYNWDMVAYVPLIGIEIAITSLVGRYMGARKPDTAHASTLSGIKVGFIYSVVMLVLFLAFPIALSNVFRPSVHDKVFADALPLTLFMVRLMAIYVLVESMIVSYCGALRGAGDTFWAMFISVSLHWLMVVVLYVLFNVMHVSAQAAWVFIIIWVMLLSLAFYLRYRSGKWKEIQLV
jgi:MATE family multidrug resistance protein